MFRSTTRRRINGSKARGSPVLRFLAMPADWLGTRSSTWTAHKRTLQRISLNMSPPTNAGWAKSIIMIPQKFCGQNRSEERRVGKEGKCRRTAKAQREKKVDR